MTRKPKPISIERMLEHIFRELEMSSTVFSVSPGYRGEHGRRADVPGGWVELPLGVAAGPHGMMAQNLVAAYVAGARVFELPVLTLPAGEEGYIRTRDVHQPRPCPMTLAESLEEYIKAGFVIRLLARELGLGDPEGWAFLMGVEGSAGALTAPEMQEFFAYMEDASEHPMWERCCRAALANLGGANNLDEEYVEGLSAGLSGWVSLTVRPGDAPKDVEDAGLALLEMGLHLSLKVTPQTDWEELRPVFYRLRDKGDRKDLTVALSVSGATTLPDGSWRTGSSTTHGALALAAKAAADLPGTPIAFAGGADAFNVGQLYTGGLSPILASTTLLKPGGYLRLRQMAKAMTAAAPRPVPDAGWLEGLLERLPPRKPTPQRVRIPEKAPMLDCFAAPCRGGCPFDLDITGFLRLMSDGRFRDALQVILDRDPLPNITGAICPAPCEDHCTRLFYDEAIDIRGAGGLCTQIAWEDVLARMEPGEPLVGQRVAVIGGGPAGMACAFLLRRRGVPVTLFEREKSLGGAVRRVIPAFRVPHDAIDRDAQLLDLMGADVRLGVQAPPAPQVLKMGYSHVVVATGAPVSALVPLEGEQPVDVLTFLRNTKNDPAAYKGVKQIAILGGGNAAMDAARAALRLRGVASAAVVSPAFTARPRELSAAENEGAALLTGMGSAWDGETLTFLRDDQELRIPAQLVIAAAGRTVDGAALTAHGATLDSHGLPQLSQTMEAGEHIYVIGDAGRGDGNVAQAIGDAHRVVDSILGAAAPWPHTAGRRGSAMGKKGKLQRKGTVEEECERCLGCSTVCECCVDVCPNRANIPVLVPTRRKPQILHLDARCGRCGNCGAYCPFETEPHKEKFTLFDTLADFQTSENPGFVVLDFLSRKVRVRLDGKVRDASLRKSESRLPAPVQELMETIFIDYPYLLDTTRREGEEQLSLW